MTFITLRQNTGQPPIVQVCFYDSSKVNKLNSFGKHNIEKPKNACVKKKLIRKVDDFK